MVLLGSSPTCTKFWSQVVFFHFFSGGHSIPLHEALRGQRGASGRLDLAALWPGRGLCRSGANHQAQPKKNRWKILFGARKVPILSHFLMTKWVKKPYLWTSMMKQDHFELRIGLVVRFFFFFLCAMLEEKTYFCLGGVWSTQKNTKLHGLKVWRPNSGPFFKCAMKICRPTSLPAGLFMQVLLHEHNAHLPAKTDGNLQLSTFASLFRLTDWPFVSVFLTFNSLAQS